MTNAALLTQKFKVLHRVVMCLQQAQGSERTRKAEAAHCLSEGSCLPFDGAAAQRHGRRQPTDASFETMLGCSSWIDSLFVWFPAP